MEFFLYRLTFSYNFLYQPSFPLVDEKRIQVFRHYRDVTELIQEELHGIECIFSSENNTLVMGVDERSLSCFLSLNAPSIQKTLLENYKPPLEVTPDRGSIAYTRTDELLEKFGVKAVIHLVVVKKGVFWLSNSATPDNVADVFRKGLHMANEKGYSSIAVRFPFTSKSNVTPDILRSAMEKVIYDPNLVDGWKKQSLRTIHLCQL